MPTPLKSIRLKCLDCCVGSSYEVKLCTSVKCALFPYRLGKRPTRQECPEKTIASPPLEQNQKVQETYETT
jgi:hypothetical protein